ncbi:unnamed protein product [Dicrocoelium dendriticum]|nr:unnamed protein product [Dicrocoelium dendriticum]
MAKISYSLSTQMPPKSVSGINCDCSAEGEFVKTVQMDQESDTDYLEKLRKFSKWTSHGAYRALPDSTKCRRSILRVLYSIPVNITVIIMAWVNAVILVVALLLESETLKADSGEKRNRLNEARFGLQCVSMCISSIFSIEICMKLFALGPKTFFSHWIEVWDLVVIVISLIVDAIIISAHVARIRTAHGSDPHYFFNDPSSDPLAAVGAAAALLVIFRLWRIVGIMNAEAQQLNFLPPILLSPRTLCTWGCIRLHMVEQIFELISVEPMERKLQELSQEQRIIEYKNSETFYHGLNSRIICNN